MGKSTLELNELFRKNILESMSEGLLVISFDGVVNYANVHDIRHFTIRKIIEWEKHDSPVEWRTQMCDLYSKVK